MQKTTPSFSDYAALGYTRLVPIVPPGAPIAPTSALARALNTDRDPRGKAVGVKGRDGDWRGFDWVNHESDETDLTRWQAMGAGIGVKLGQGLIAIDADTTNADFARIVRDVIEEHLGRMPVRIGRYPKALYLCRVDGEFRYSRVEFGERDEKNRLLERVEILSDGRQFVAEGVHPGTGSPYYWPRELTSYDELPVFRVEQIDAVMAALRKALPAASEVIREGATTEVRQESLKGTVELIRKAVAATPNTSALFPSRESYRDYGYAIKAALPDDQDEALEIFQDWCARWDEGENDPNVVSSDWRRMKPPFRRGAGWLYDLAETHSGGKFTSAEIWFEPISEDSPLAEIFPTQTATQRLFELLSIDQIFTRPDPKFTIDRHIPEQSVGFLYGDPGTGKSFIALDWALHLAFGRENWHGDPIEPAKGTVLYLAGEGASGFKTRVRAWMERHEVRSSEYAKFALLPASVNFMNAEDVTALAATLRAKLNSKVAMIVVDTVSRAMPGADENLQKDMTMFVKACDALKEEFGCSVLGVHHAGKKGDMRGSTVLLGAGDYVFKLERKKGHPVGFLHCEKQKDAPDGWQDSYRFDHVDLGDGHSSLVPMRCASTGSELDVTANLAKEVLAAMAKAWDAGEPWGPTYHAKERFAERILVRDFGIKAERAADMLDLWEKSGAIRQEIVDKKSKRKGYKVVWDADAAVELAENDIFG